MSLPNMLVRSLALTIVTFLVLSGVLQVVYAFDILGIWEAMTADQKAALQYLAGAYIGVKIAGWLLRRSRPAAWVADLGRSVPLGIARPVTRGASAHRPASSGASTNSDDSVINQLERIRVHEAGHAAVALHLGFELEEISTVAEGTSGGHVTLASHPAGNRSNEAFWNKAIMASSGAAAELKFLGEAEAAGVTSDLREVQLICSALAATGFELNNAQHTAAELFDEAQRQARNNVDIVERHIGALVEAVKRRPALTGLEAAKVFDTAELGK